MGDRQTDGWVSCHGQFWEVLGFILFEKVDDCPLLQMRVLITLESFWLQIEEGLSQNGIHDKDKVLTH